MSAHPRYLEHIQESIHALLNGTAAGDLMFFAGAQQEAIPATLFLDPTLRPVDRNLWVVMRLCMRSGGQQVAFPSYEDLESVWRVGSRDTLSIAFTLLRLRGWITRCHTVRDAEGRYRGRIWMVHDEPAPLAEIIEFDPEYMTFFDECRAHRSPRVRAAAIAMDATMASAIQRGEDITTHTSAYARRFGSLTAKFQNDGDFFGVDLAVLARMREEGHPPDEPSQKIGLGEFTPVRKSDSAPPSQKIGLREKSDLVNQSQKIGLGNKSLNFNDNEFGTVSALKSSSSKNLNTTTTTRGLSDDFPEKLKSALSQNERDVIGRYLAGVPAQQRPDILGYLTERLAAGLVDKPVPFAISLVRAAKEGRFYRQPPAASPASRVMCPPPAASPPTAAEQLRQLNGEAVGLRQLISAVKDPAARSMLAQQLTEIENKASHIRGMFP